MMCENCGAPDGPNFGLCLHCVEDPAVLDELAEQDEHGATLTLCARHRAAMTNLNLIAMVGYARSGKDTVAAALAEDGWQRHAFADTLREFAYILNPLVPLPKRRFGRQRTMRLRVLVDQRGWERAKTEVPEVREFLQRLGTDAGRKLLGEDVWVEAALAKVDGRAPVIFTDCRFPNEADAVRGRGGRVVRVTRPGVGPVNSHESETAMDGYDHVHAVLENAGSVAELHAAARALVAAGG